jgi:hypothetical protein
MMNTTVLPDPEDARVPLDKMLPPVVVSIGQLEADKALKLRVAGGFIEFMAGKGLDKIAPRDVSAHHLSEWLGHI